MSKLILVVLAATVLSISYVPGQGCISYKEWDYSALKRSQAAYDLTIEDIEDCYVSNSAEDRYEKAALLNTYYSKKDIDSSLYYVDKMISISRSCNLSNDMLSNAYWIKGIILSDMPDKLRAQVYLSEAEKIAIDEILRVYIKIDRAYLSGIYSINSNSKKYIGDKYNYQTFDYYSLSNHKTVKNQEPLVHSKSEINDLLKIKDPYFRYYFMLRAIYDLKNTLGTDELAKMEDICDSIYSTVFNKNFLLEFRHHKYKTLGLINKGRYIDGFNEGLNLIKLNGIDTISLANPLKKISTFHEKDALIVHAKSLLFLTREGKGIYPVKKAYAIYIHLIKTKRNEIEYSYFLNRSNYATIKEYRILDNILVIAKYLTQKTGDARYLTEAYSALDELKSASVRSGIRRNGWIDEGGTFADLLLQDNDLSREIHQVFSTYIQGDDEEAYFEQLESLFSERDLLEKKLQPYIEEAMHNEPKIEITESIQTIQEEQLTDSTGIILISSGAHHHSLLILRDTILTSNLLEQLPNLEAYTSLTRLLSDPNTNDQELTKQSRKLYTALFGEYEGYLPPYLSIIANGPFETYPFAALRTDTSGSARYFGQDHVLNYHYSLRTYLYDRENKRSSAKRELLALAPSFDERRKYSARRNIGDEASSFYLSPLHYNQSEVNNLSTSFPGRFLTDTEATTDNFNDLVTDYGIIHLATHAVANASFGSQGGFFLEGFTEDPNDALITAGEITTYHLNADLVSLSACESGLGSVVFTEGTVGLTRSFSTAGAKSVLSTLWTVDDQSTAEIVTDFYNLLRRGNNKTVALSTAQENFRKKYAGTERERPYYWAAFVLVGNNDPIEWLGSDPFNWSYFVIAAGLMTIAFFYFQRKRQTYSS